jgi:hypothetical protein
MRQSLHRACITVLAVWIFMLSLPCTSLNGETNSRDNWSQSLNVIALESLSAEDQIPKKQSNVRTLTSADFPTRITKLYYSMSPSAMLRTNELALSGNVNIVDICSFNFSNKDIEESKLRIPAKLATHSGLKLATRSEATLGCFNPHLHGQHRSTKTMAESNNTIISFLFEPAT